MSWGYRSYRSKFYFSEKEIDFTTEYLDYSQFLLQEFFSADLETRKKLSQYYLDKFGSRSFAYLKRKYSEWANGDYHLTDLMRERILSIMPNFLNEAANHKLGTHEFMATIKSSIKSFAGLQNSTYRTTTNLKTPQDVLGIFEKEFENIKNVSFGRFRFNVLSPEEKQEALEITKYILETKLQISFDQIERDFNVFLPYMFRFNRGIFSATYSIRAFNLKLSITKTGLNDITIPKFKIREIEANSQFKTYADKYLAYELVNIHSQSQKAIGNSFLNAHDIKLFFDHYEELSFGESEVNMKSTFQGEGGTLFIQAQMKPLKMLKTSLAVSSAKLLIYSITFVGLVSVAINYKLFGMLIIGGLIAVGIFWGLLSEEIKQIKNIQTEIKQYGQQ